MSVPNYKKLGHRFKKRRLLSNTKALFLSHRMKKSERTVYPQTCLLLRLDHLGDYVLFRNFLPVIRNSARFKGWHLTLCANVVCKELAHHLDAGHVDDFIWIDVERLKKRRDYFMRVVDLLYRRGFSVAVQPTFSRDIYGDMLMQATAAGQRIGVDGDCMNQNERQRLVTDSFYTTLIKVHNTPRFEFERNREIIENIIQQPVAVKMPSLPRLGKDRPLANAYAVVMPGTSSVFKYWPCLFEIADYLYFQHGLEIRLLGKGKRDQRWILDIMKRCKCPAVNLCNQTSLLEAAAVLARAHIVVGNDSGLIHMAVLLNVPTVCLTAGTHAFRFNHYPENYGFKVRFVFPPELDKKKGSKAFEDYAAQYASGYDVSSIPVAKVKRAIEEVLCHGS